jgi:hypothetical protein
MASNALKAVTSSKTNEWYTPAWVMEIARAGLGVRDIRLDPASCELANKTVQADQFFTKEDDGLAQDWDAYSVFMNPPYGGKVGPFLRKLVSELDADRVNCAAVLVNALPGRKWFQENIWEHADVVFFFNKRVKFVDEEGAVQDKPTQDNVMAFYGVHTEATISVLRSQYGDLGTVIRCSDVMRGRKK